jgi:ribosomal protein S25
MNALLSLSSLKKSVLADCIVDSLFILLARVLLRMKKEVAKNSIVTTDMITDRFCFMGQALREVM